MKKRKLSPLLLCVSLFLTGCLAEPYREADVLGKSSGEIADQYGLFDCVTAPAGEDGLYRNARGGYTVREPQTGFLGTSEEVLFFIIFDENGIAVACETAPRPGG